MNVRIRFFASVRDIVGKAEMDLDLPGGSSAGDLLDQLTERYPRLQGLAPSLLLSVNREYADSHHPLREGDEVALIPPVSGGCRAV